MTDETIRLLRLSRQHLLFPSDSSTVARDLCGIQCQYLNHARHALSIRTETVDTDSLVKSWTLRGTMHLFRREDLPLMLHRNRGHFLRDVDTLRTDDRVSGQRKAFFAEGILDAVSRGMDTREELKILCRNLGMTETEETSLFDPWGGIIRALCEEGRICHKVMQEKAYSLCPAFTPMDRDSARLELLNRYFAHFGPASIKDAAYFFGWTQREIRQFLPRLELESVTLGNLTLYHSPGPEPETDMPRCLFLAGFDQLMLGYEKTGSLFLPRENLRDIFTRSGIVRPALLVDGTVKGHWNLKNNCLTIQCFTALDQAPIRRAAETRWPELKNLQIL